ncbi:MAG: non-heme iron oxygenase ferredoxin subunit [Actinomycetales bacterium]
MSISISLSDLTPGKPVKVQVGEKEACVVRVENDVFAVSDMCSHSEASLSEGEVTDHKIECWLHGAEFDLRTGAALTPPATDSLEVFSVTLEGNTVTISEGARN